MDKRKRRIERICPTCYGRGWVPGFNREKKICPECYGDKTLVEFIWVDKEEKDA